MPRETMDCQESRISLGVYVLGAIEPADRALVDHHLATCRDCRDELAGLAGLPALLARVSPEEAMALAATDGAPDGGLGQEPPRELLGTVLDLTAARQRRRRWREAALAVAAALIIAAGVFGGVHLAAGPGPAAGPYAGPANSAWEKAQGQSGSLSAVVTYRSMGWGTQLAAKVDGIPVGTHCQLWVVSATGQRTLAGSWLTDGNEGAVWYPASAALAAKDVAGFEITVGQGEAIAIDA